MDELQRLKAQMEALDILDEMAEGEPLMFFQAWIDLRRSIRKAIREIERNREK